jgi:predicted SnoaL-like aldol condensation-catalyzing enzyme
MQGGSPKYLEGEFSELRHNAVLRSSSGPIRWARGIGAERWSIRGMCRRWRACYGALVHTRRKEQARSEQENKTVSRRVAEEIFNEGNLDLAEELFAPDYVLHDPSLPEDLHGPEGLKQHAAMNLGAFPDARVTVEDQIAEGEMVVTRWTATGAHTGELLGIPPPEGASRYRGSPSTASRGVGSRRIGTRATTLG